VLGGVGTSHGTFEAASNITTSAKAPKSLESLQFVNAISRMCLDHAIDTGLYIGSGPCVRKVLLKRPFERLVT
jgi:hypothetical protein